MKAVIHIGQPKAGSTSLQRVLQKNRSALADHGVQYTREKRNPGQDKPLLLAVTAWIVDKMNLTEKSLPNPLALEAKRKARAAKRANRAGRKGRKTARRADSGKRNARV